MERASIQENLKKSRDTLRSLTIEGPQGEDTDSTLVVDLLLELPKLQEVRPFDGGWFNLPVHRLLKPLQAPYSTSMQSLIPS